MGISGNICRALATIHSAANQSAADKINGVESRRLRRKRHDSHAGNNAKPVSKAWAAKRKRVEDGPA